MFLRLLSLVLVTLAYGSQLQGRSDLPSPTTIEAHKLIPRDVPTATVLFGFAGNYIQYPDENNISSPAPTGTDFTFVPGASPFGGIDLYLGPDLQNKLHDAVLTNCVRSNDPACQASVAALLDPKQLGLQSRQLAVLAALGVWLSSLAVAALTMVFKSGLGAQANGSFRLPQTDIAQVQSATSANVLVFATATDDVNSMIVTATPSPEIFEGNVTTDANGDLSINLPQELATILNDLIAQNSACANANKERALDSNILGCVSAVTDTVLQNTVQGAAAPLILVHGDMRLPANADLLRALNALVQGGGRVAIAALVLVPDAANFLIELSFWLVYAKLVDKLSITPSTKIPADELEKKCPGAEVSCDEDTCQGQGGICTTGPNKDCPCTNSCPPHDLTPMCVNCGGGTGTCLGIADHNLLWEGCPCMTDPRLPYEFLGQAFFQQAQLGFTNPTLLPIGSLVQCDPVSLAVDTKLFSSLITTFCQTDLNLQSFDEQTLTYQNASSPSDWTAYKEWKFDFHWTPAPNPALNPNPPTTLCNDTWSFFTEGNGCSKNTNMISASGVYSPAVGIAEYHITNPTKTTSSAPPGPTGPAPTKEILVIWDTPPVSGPTFYDFYEEKLGYSASLDNSCGAIVTDNFPFLSIADPDQGKVDPNRPKNGFTRKAPGKLGPMQVGKSCQYVENTLNTASITCADNTWPCSLPASALAGTVEPNNGACGGVQNVRQLIMVCPFGE